MTFPVLEDKVAIVTGAAMGMGEATAKLFAEAKAKVIITDFNEEKGIDVAESIQANDGDAAVNNVALTPDDQPADEFDEEYCDRLISVDLKGVALCQKYGLQQFKKQGNGGPSLTFPLSVDSVHNRTT